MPSVAVRVDRLRVDGDEGRRQFGFWSSVRKTLRMSIPHLVECTLSLVRDRVDTVEEHIGWGEE